MQIEQFDTGLKNQNNFQELKITAKENKQNKQIVRNYLIFRINVKGSFIFL